MQLPRRKDRRFALDSVAGDARYQALVESIAQIVWTASPAGEFTEAQPSWQAYTGQTVEECRGWGWLDAVHPEDRLRFRQLWARAVQTRDALHLEHRLRAANGTFRWVVARAVPVRGAFGAVTEWVGAHVDVHEARLMAEERARLYQAERAARADAESANRAKMEFLAVISHELRTPLNSIAGYAELLEMGLHGALSDAQRADVEAIHRNERHLLRLVERVLGYAKIEAGRVELDVAEVRLRATVESVLELVAPQMEQRRLVLSVSDCEAELRVLADGERLQQILLNLLSNAAKFTPVGGTIAITCDVQNDRARVHVRDSGVGIPDDELERIFEPFVQLEAAEDTPGGTGLGLAISRGLARTMGGDVLVASEPGRGSVFTLVLPVVRR